jgi:flagellar biosynthesis/type III secretory pathway chaperone
MRGILQQRLHEEHALADQFWRLLTEEQFALVGGSLERLDLITEHKARLIERLERATRQREADQASLGLPAGAAGLDAMSEEDPVCAASWAALHELALRCRAQNEINGAVVDTMLEVNTELLDVVRLTAPVPLYRRDGRSDELLRGVRVAAR